MPTDPIVIVCRRPHADGRLPGRTRRAFPRLELGAAAIRAAVERAKIKPEQTCRKSSWAACCPRARAGARAPGFARRRPAARDRLHHGQQDVRLRNEGGDARARLFCLREPTKSLSPAAWNP